MTMAKAAVLATHLRVVPPSTLQTQPAKLSFDQCHAGIGEHSNIVRSALGQRMAGAASRQRWGQQGGERGRRCCDGRRHQQKQQ